MTETGWVDDREERPVSFLAGAWMNRRYTRSSSSILLGLAPTALLVMSSGQLPVIGPALVEAGVLTPTSSVFVTIVTAVIALANLLMFPFAREIYFRSTQPMREGTEGVLMFGLLFVVWLVARVVMFLVVWALAIPMGLVGLLTLGDEDRRGLGWRIN